MSGIIQESHIPPATETTEVVGILQWRAYGHHTEVWCWFHRIKLWSWPKYAELWRWSQYAEIALVSTGKDACIPGLLRAKIERFVIASPGTVLLCP